MAPNRKSAAASSHKRPKYDTQFSWQSADELDPSMRIKILEEAVEKAIYHSRFIKDFIHDTGDSPSEELRKGLSEIGGLLDTIHRSTILSYR